MPAHDDVWCVTGVGNEAKAAARPLDVAGRFLAGDDREAEQRRSCMFKLIPSVVKGSWVIKQAVGNTPVLLGKKLTTRYYRLHTCTWHCMQAMSHAAWS